MQNDLLAGFRLAVLEKKLNVYGITLRQRGQIVAEHCWRAPERTILHSVSKSFTSMAAGIAIEEGRFCLQDRVSELFSDCLPEDADDRLRQMTVEHLLTMSTGQEDGDAVPPSGYEGNRNDWVRYFLSKKITSEPGTRFLYDNGATYMVSAIIQMTTGLTLRDYLVPRLFGPLGIEWPQWFTCPMGRSWGYSGLFLTAEELSRFGQMLLDGGVWQGRQLVPVVYVERATHTRIASIGAGHLDPEGFQGYGYFFWRNTLPNSYRADGRFGQFCVVLPDYDAVAAITSHEDNMFEILRCVYSEILSVL